MEHPARERSLGADLPQGAVYWTQRQKAEPATCPWLTDSVLPIVAANRVVIVKSAHAFDELVTLIPTPGHTIDHYSVQVGKPGADAVITGDMIHSPLQARYPELVMSDYDSKRPDKRGASCSAASARPLRSCARRTFPRHRRAVSCAGAIHSIS
jgi:glyoxylase-like metal-dependent hydrolase (beta-lactamase superfamily II)